jgi:thermitase
VLYTEPDQYRLLVIPDEKPGPTPAGQSNYFGEQWYLSNTGQSHTRVDQTIFGPVLSTTQGTDDAGIDAIEAWGPHSGLADDGPHGRRHPKVAVLDSGADCDTLELQGKCLEQKNLVGLNPGFFELDRVRLTNLLATTSATAAPLSPLSWLPTRTTAKGSPEPGGTPVSASSRSAT